MQQGKKPTRQQKERLRKARLCPENWLVVSERLNGELIILHRHVNSIRVMPSLVGQ